MRVARTNEGFPLTPPAVADPAAGPPNAGEGATRADPVAAPSTGSASPRFEQLLRGLGQELDRGENISEKAIRGGTSHASPEHLIALQAGIYRYSEAVDLVTKLVDKGTQAVRTTLQNQ